MADRIFETRNPTDLIMEYSSSQFSADLTQPKCPEKKVAFLEGEIPGCFREVSVGDILLHLAIFLRCLFSGELPYYILEIFCIKQL